MTSVLAQPLQSGSFLEHVQHSVDPLDLERLMPGIDHHTCSLEEGGRALDKKLILLCLLAVQEE